MPAPFDEIQFPWKISLGAKLGPTGSTDIIICSSGYEQRNANWALPRRRYDVSTGLQSDGDVGQLIAFFMARMYGYRGFRFKDWKDYSALQGSDLNAAALTPYPQSIPPGPPYQPMALSASGVWQLQKTYQYGGTGTGVVDAITVVRTIVKPCNYGTHEAPLTHPDGTPAIPVTLYEGSGNVLVPSSLFSVAYTTGLVSAAFANGALSQTSSGSLGAATYYVISMWVTAAGEMIASAETSLAVSANNVLNVAHPTNAPSGATGWNVYVATSSGTETRQNGSSPIGVTSAWIEPTSGLVGGAALPAIPSANFEFDVPCRFDTDDMSMTAENWNTNVWQNIPVIEVRL